MRKYLLLLPALMTLALCKAQISEPGKASDKEIILLGGTYHLGNGSVLENGYLVIKNGLITEIGVQSSYKKDQHQGAIVKETSGKDIYPGFINLNNTLGITEVDAVRASNDLKETGMINPNVRSIIAYNTESRITPTVRSNGVLLSQPTPRGSLISGQSSMVQLDAWNWEDALVKENDGVHVYWPSKHSQWGTENKKQAEQISTLTTFLEDAFAYSKQSDNSNIKLEAMRGVFNGQKRLYLHADKQIDIVEGVLAIQKVGIKKPVIMGGSESDKILDFLKKNALSVVLKRVHRLPDHAHTPVLAPYKLASILQKAGIPYALSMVGDMEAMNSRNLPFLAGTTVAYEVPYEKAIESITLAPARITGIDSNYGSLEVGKSATLFISAGDALDMRTNLIELAFIDGREIDLGSPQKALYEKYSKKYGLETSN